jgi:hypothetical protein
MKDFIKDRLNKIKSLDERRNLRTVILDVYENIVDYNMNMYHKLEERIYNEIEDDLSKYYIYSTIEYRDEIDPINDFLYPMLESDLEPKRIDNEAIKDELSTKNKVILDTFFMQCNFLELKKLISINNRYRAKVETDNGNTYEVYVSLKMCTKYMDQVKMLYEVFKYNNKVFNTINCVYICKFVDVILESDLKFNDDEALSSVYIDLEEHNRDKIVNVVPLWNIRYIDIEEKSFPVPAKDRINHEHNIQLEEYGILNGYMLSKGSKDVLYTKQTENELIVVSSSGDVSTFKLVQVSQADDAIKNKSNFIVVSNKRDLGFVGRYTSIKSMIIRTVAELEKIVNMYDDMRDLEFKKAVILDIYDKEEQTIDYNGFVDDNIREDKYKKILLIKFKAKPFASAFVQDKMSFLTSEIQLLYPEYKCIGELINHK